MITQSANLTIRPLESGDVDDVFEYMSDPQTTFYLPEGCLTRTAVVSFVNQADKAYAIVHSQLNKVVGHIEFFPWFGEHTYEIGWVINPNYQRQGIGYEAAAQVLAYGFEHLGLRRVIATAQPENCASYLLMEKLGMIREGHFRQCIPRPNNLWWDEYFYSMLKTDYERKTKTSA